MSHIISLNWDTFLEAAFENRFGIAVNAQQKTLWKPHGDCASPTNDWILPHEPGYVPDELLHVLTALVQDRPRTLVIVGYSERDEVVVQRLISPLAARWRVFRISPGASGEGAIPLSAHEALQEFADALCPNPDVPGCKPVTFANQRGLEGAISGVRLGPQDVDACPRLPMFDTAVGQLELLNKVDITGSPGCGKSITGWQLARVFHKKGWEVLTPQTNDLDVEVALQAIHKRTWNRVLVIDDAQVLPPAFVEALRETAANDLKRRQTILK